MRWLSERAAACGGVGEVVIGVAALVLLVLFVHEVGAYVGTAWAAVE